jgi:NitT/TauT family transport system substrate-binding protein
MVFFQKNPQAFMVRDESPVKSFADINGHTVAVKPGAIYFQFLSKKYHWDKVKVAPSTGTVANFVRDPDYIQQAYPTNEPFYAKKAGVKPRLLQVSESGFDPYRCVVTTEQMLKEHPDWVETFVRGAYAGWSAYLKNPEKGNALILKLNPTQSPEGMLFAFKTMCALRFVEGEAARGDAPGQIKPERFAELAHQMQDLGLLRQDLNVGESYTTRFTPEALHTSF